MMDRETYKASPPEHWKREPQGSPRWECWNAYRRLVDTTYEENAVPSSVMDYVATYTYWAMRVAQESLERSVRNLDAPAS